MSLGRQRLQLSGQRCPQYGVCTPDCEAQIADSNDLIAAEEFATRRHWALYWSRRLSPVAPDIPGPSSYMGLATVAN